MKSILFLFVLVVALWLASAAYPLFYDFSDENQLLDWEVIGDADWRIEDGVLICEEPAGPRQQQRLEHKEIEFKSGTIQFKIMWVSGTWLEGGVYYRLQDDDNWYNVHLSNCCDPNAPSMRWMAMVNAALDWTPTVIELETEVWYDVKLIIEGDRHQVFLDDKQLWDDNHDLFEAGKLAIGTWSAVQEVWHIDDLEIEGEGIATSAVQAVNKLATRWGTIKRQ